MKKISLIFLALVLCFAMTACGGGASQDTPTGAVEGLLKAIKEKKTEDIEKFYQGKAEDISMNVGEEGESGLDPKIEKQLVEKIFDFEYTVIKEEVKEDKATVEVEIKAYDFGKMFQEVISEAMTMALADLDNPPSEEEANKMMTDLFKTKLDGMKERTYVKTVKLDLVKAEKGWQIVDQGKNSPLMGALSGGMLDMFGGEEDAADEEAA